MKSFFNRSFNNIRIINKLNITLRVCVSRVISIGFQSFLALPQMCIKMYTLNHLNLLGNQNNGIKQIMQGRN